MASAHLNRSMIFTFFRTRESRQRLKKPFRRSNIVWLQNAPGFITVLSDTFGSTNDSHNCTE